MHLRLLVPDPMREDVAALVATLRAAGHVVTTGPDEPVPPGVALLPDLVVTDGGYQPVPEDLEAAEARHIAAVLARTHGNRRQAALLLGIARSTLLRKIRRHGL